MKSFHSSQISPQILSLTHPPPPHSIESSKDYLNIQNNLNHKNHTNSSEQNPKHQQKKQYTKE